MKNEMLVNAPAINRQFGLKQSGYDEELYNWALKRFAKDNASVLENMNDAIGSGNFELARRIAHTLKGVSGSLGAMRLQEAARVAEYALSDGSIDESQMLPLKAAFDDVLHELGPLLAEPPPSKRTASALNAERALKLIDELSPLLQSCNSRCFSLLTEINEILGPVGDTCELLTTQIEDCDFLLAFETLKDIRQLAQG